MEVPGYLREQVSTQRHPNTKHALIFVFSVRRRAEKVKGGAM